MITFKCHGCGTAFRLSDDKAGKKAKCPKCGAVLLVPTPLRSGAGQPGISQEVRSASLPDPPGKRLPEEPVETAHSSTAMPPKRRLPVLFWAAGGVAASAAIAVVLVLIWGATHDRQSYGPQPGPKGDSDSGAAWQHDWREFGKLLGSLTQTEPSVEKVIEKMNLLLSDKDVEWSGIVQKVVLPGGSERPTLSLRMEKLSVSLPGQPDATAESVRLSPTNEEWKAWASVGTGARVIFRTRLVKRDMLGCNGVVAFVKFSGQMVSGPETGKPINAVWVTVNTSGAELIRSLGGAPVVTLGGKAIRVNIEGNPPVFLVANQRIPATQPEALVAILRDWQSRRVNAVHPASAPSGNLGLTPDGGSRSPDSSQGRSQTADRPAVEIQCAAETPWHSVRPVFVAAAAARIETLNVIAADRTVTIRLPFLGNSDGRAVRPIHARLSLVGQDPESIRCEFEDIGYSGDMGTIAHVFKSIREGCKSRWMPIVLAVADDVPTKHFVEIYRCASANDLENIHLTAQDPGSNDHLQRLESSNSIAIPDALIPDAPPTEGCLVVEQARLFPPSATVNRPGGRLLQSLTVTKQRSVVYIVDVSGVAPNALAHVNADIGRSINNMNEGQQFHVILISGAALRELTIDGHIKMQSATLANKEATIKWIDDQEVEPKTPVADPRAALQRAFGVDGGRPQTIFLLSQGELPPDIPDVVERLNPTKKCRINTILLLNHTAEGERLMIAIARDNGGTYSFINKDDLEKRD